jgi:hypothetical protein
MNKSNFLIVLVISYIWLYVVMFVAYPQWMIHILDDTIFLQMFTDIRKTEVGSILIEKKTFMVAFLAALDYVILGFVEGGPDSKPSKQTLCTFALFLGALFMQAFFETITKNWPFLFLIFIILLIKFSSLFTFFRPIHISELQHKSL